MNGPWEPGPARRGAVLPFVVLLTLGLLALAHGLLASALGELGASRGAARHLITRSAAEAGSRLAAASPGGRWMDSVGLWEARQTDSTTLGRATVRSWARRLGREAWLVEGSARLPGGSPTRAARLAWALDPLTRVERLGAVVSVGGAASVSVEGRIDTGQMATASPPASTEDCAPWADSLATHFAVDPPLAVAPVSSGAVGLGRLGIGELLAVTNVQVAGAGSPAPRESLGACVTDEAWSWGDPLRPWRPCAEHLALRASASDLTVSGGVGQGLLVVGGDLTFEAGARFHGLVVVAGRLRLHGTSRLHGMALAGGGLDVAPGAVVMGSACWAVRVLSAHRVVLSRFEVVMDPEWLGPL